MNIRLCPSGTLVAALAVLGALAVSACTPALDWRELRPAGLSLVASLPCKPDGHARRLTLAGAEVEWTLLACSAGGHTYALASADLQDPARVPVALTELAATARANVRGVVQAEAAAQVPGMTPQPQARQWHLAGQLPDGQAVQLALQVFAHGTRVYQATMVGAVADVARERQFFDGMRVAP